MCVHRQVRRPTTTLPNRAWNHEQLILAVGISIVIAIMLWLLNVIESVLTDLLTDCCAVCCSTSGGRPKSKAMTTLAGKLQELYNTVRDYTDSHGRTLSTPYMKLPPKSVS